MTKPPHATSQEMQTLLSQQGTPYKISTTKGEHMTTQRTTKIGENRGRPRVWLQGAILTEAGFKRGDLFTAKISDGKLVIERDAQGDRTISGKGDVPLLDIAGAALLQVAAVGTPLKIRAKVGKLTLTPDSD